MGTKDITQAEFERLSGRQFIPGDRLHDFRTGVSFTFQGKESYFVVGVTDDGQPYREPIGNVERWHDEEETHLAIWHARDAGYVPKQESSGGWVWWNAEHGHGWGAGKTPSAPNGLIDTYGHNEPPCDECGVTVERFKGPLCFYCGFWLEHVAHANDNSIRIGGKHYMDGGKTDNYFKGFGGRKFCIVMDDGQEIETYNLWSQGPIPDRFRDRLPDNAVFQV